MGIDAGVIEGADMASLKNTSDHELASIIILTEVVGNVLGANPVMEPAFDFTAATQAIYAGEENVMHGGVDVTQLTGIDSAAVSEGWDEPLNKDQVLGIASLFLA